ncbi:MAG: uncharacterized protein KVP18_000392 [Porospora cf. gigantea A]|uniref:uncharacterized protein n=1 Tax=Porospora cf. gigantea A TaxID=2853593 RepID=UPI00355A0802|nr:MAG: hypothetical protein KVP18_000392 [Porospora cf. gigantea A]
MCVGLYSGFKGGGGEIELAPEALTTYNDLMTLCSSLDVFDLNEWDNHTRSMWEASQVTQVIKTLNHPPEMPTVSLDVSPDAECIPKDV